MFDSSYLWESIHALGYLSEDIYVMHLVLEIACNYEYLWSHRYLNCYILCSFHAIIEVKIFDFHAHVLVSYVRYDAVYMHFHRG